ncbi:hypothetical protein KIPB_010854, partial [Kipferlia bialata]
VLHELPLSVLPSGNDHFMFIFSTRIALFSRVAGHVVFDMSYEDLCMKTLNQDGQPILSNPGVMTGCCFDQCLTSAYVHSANKAYLLEGSVDGVAWLEHLRRYKWDDALDSVRQIESMGYCSEEDARRLALNIRDFEGGTTFSNGMYKESAKAWGFSDHPMEDLYLRYTSVNQPESLAIAVRTRLQGLGASADSVGGEDREVSFSLAMLGLEAHLEVLDGLDIELARSWSDHASGTDRDGSSEREKQECKTDLELIESRQFRSKSRSDLLASRATQVSALVRYVNDHKALLSVYNGMGGRLDSQVGIYTCI